MIDETEDLRLCPSCGELGTPETFRNATFRMSCRNPTCDYEEEWDCPETVPETGEFGPPDTAAFCADLDALDEMLGGECPHGNAYRDGCSECDALGDMAFDAAREAR